MNKKISITKPSISELEINYVNDAISHGWGPHCYDYIYRFQDEFTKHLGCNHALATSSCTGAIHLGLMALGVEADDEVIVPESTWIASVEPVLYIGAKPIFVDVKKDTWCIDPESIRKSITPKTKAIIVVHLYGNVAEMDEIMQIAREHDIKVLEDAAEGLGSVYKNKRCGSIGHAGVFSFHGTKSLSTGEGGMLVTQDQSTYDKASILNDHGRNPKINKTFWMENYGYKYKMSNLQAAMGCAQIERAEEILNGKRLVFSWYKEYLTDVRGIQLNEEQSYAVNGYWMPTIVFEANIDRDNLIDYLKERNIDSRPFFYPLSSLPMFESIKENHIAYEIFSKGINLPSHGELVKEDIENICNHIKTYLKSKL